VPGRVAYRRRGYLRVRDAEQDQTPPAGAVAKPAAGPGTAGRERWDRAGVEANDVQADPREGAGRGARHQTPRPVATSPSYHSESTAREVSKRLLKKNGAPSRKDSRSQNEAGRVEWSLRAATGPATLSWYSTQAVDARDVLRVQFADGSARPLALSGVMAGDCNRSGMITIRV
jgi:hypothetical protein